MIHTMIQRYESSSWVKLKLNSFRFQLVHTLEYSNLSYVIHLPVCVREDFTIYLEMQSGWYIQCNVIFFCTCSYQCILTCKCMRYLNCTRNALRLIFCRVLPIYYTIYYYICCWSGSSVFVLVHSSSLSSSLFFYI